MKKTLPMLLWWPVAVWPQDPMSLKMSLKDAVHVALNRNKSVEASDASRQVAESRIAEARGGNLPKVNYSESWTRGDNPVFVFSSLLTQHQFGARNFQIGRAANPDGSGRRRDPLFEALQTYTLPDVSTKIQV